MATTHRRISISLLAVFALLLSLIPPLAHAEPESDPTEVVITALRTRGPEGAFDEYVEIRNLGSVAVDISGWRLEGCARASGNPGLRATVPAGTDPIPPGGYFLFGNSNEQYSAGTTPDLTWSTGIADDGASGARIVDGEGAMVSGVGTMHPDSQCAEGGGWASSFPTSSPYDLVRVADRADETQVTGVNADDFVNEATTPRNSAFDPDEPPPPPVVSLECEAPHTITEGYAAEDGEYVNDKAITATARDGQGELSFAVTGVVPDPADGDLTVTVDGDTAEVRFTDDVPGLDPIDTEGTYAVTIEVEGEDGSTDDCTVDVRVVPLLNIGELRGAVADDADGRAHNSPYALGSPIFRTHDDEVAVRGVVTQRLTEENPGWFAYQSFFIQSLDAVPDDIGGFDAGDPAFADGNLQTSDGLLVSMGTFSTLRTDQSPWSFYGPQVGDIVTLRGPVIEDFSQTTLANPFVVDVASPTDTGLDAEDHIEVVEVDPPDDEQEASVYWERIAGMQVEVPAEALVVSGNDFFSPSTSEIWMIRGDHDVALRDDPDARRIFRSYHPLANEADGETLDQTGFRILLGSFGIKATAGDATATITPARSGDTLDEARQGGIYFSWDKYQVMVSEQPTFTRGPDPAESSLSVVDGFDPADEYSVMVYNVENLYDFRSDPFSGCDLDPDLVPDGQTPTSTCTADEPGGSTIRAPFTYAPRSQEAYDEQREAIAEQILVTLDAPDIITIQEAEKQDVCVPVYVEEVPADSHLDCDLSAPEDGETMANTERGSGAPDTVEELALEIFIQSDGAIRYEASGDAVNGRDVRGITQAFLHRTDRVELVPTAQLMNDPVLGGHQAIDIPYPSADERTPVAPWVEEAANPKAINAELPDWALEAAGELDEAIDGGRFPVSQYAFSRAVQVGKFRIYPDGVEPGGSYVERYVTSNHMSAVPPNRTVQRTEQARLNAAVAEAIEQKGGQVLSTGDFNVFPRPDDPFPSFLTDPDREPSDQLAPMYERGFTNLHDVIIEEAPANTYSFIFQGISQILDHIFVDDDTLDELVVARYIHVNTDYPAETPGFEAGRGASDHDPLYARFLFDAEEPGPTPGAGPPCERMPDQGNARPCRADDLPPGLARRRVV